MKRKLKKAALIGLCVSMTMGNLTQILAETRSASGQNFEKIVTTGSNALPATGSNGIENYALRSVKTGDLWKDWIGDLSFLNGERGNGTEEEPYQISKFKDRTQLNDYLMAKYDVNFDQPTASPFIMENDKLMQGYRKNPNNTQ